MLTVNRQKKGQTLIEFALVSIIFIFLLVVTFNTIIGFSVQQYLSYAAFMSARAYQAAGSDPAVQERSARLVLKQYIPDLPDTGTQFGSPGRPIRFPLFRKPVGFLSSIQIPRAENGDYQGDKAPSPTRFIGLSFTVPLVELPLGEDIRANLGYVSLEARSFFGRQVSQSECRSFFRGFLNQFRIQGASVPENASFISDPRSSLYMEDNGC